MSLPTIKQIYVILKALDEEAPSGIAELVSRMTRISEEAFGTGMVYVFSPAPLGDALSDMCETGDIRILQDGRFDLTDQGRGELRNTRPLVLVGQ